MALSYSTSAEEAKLGAGSLSAALAAINSDLLAVARCQIAGETPGRIAEGMTLSSSDIVLPESTF